MYNIRTRMSFKLKLFVCLHIKCASYNACVPRRGYVFFVFQKGWGIEERRGILWGLMRYGWLWLNVLLLFILGLWSHSRIFHSYGDVTNFDLCSALMDIEQWGFLNVPHLLWHEASVYNVTSEDSWHSHLLLSVKQWICNCMLLRLRSVAAGIRTPNIPHANRTL